MKVLKELNEYTQQLEKSAERGYRMYPDYCNGKLAIIYAILSKIKELEKKYGWIPCNVRNPEKTDDYLVTKMCKLIVKEKYAVCHEIYWDDDKKWDCERAPDSEWKVIAWKEKEEPYKLEKKEEGK